MVCRNLIGIKTCLYFYLSYMLYISIHIISSFLFIYIGNQYLDKGYWDALWIMVVSLLWPFALLWLFAFQWDEIFKWKTKPKEVAPWTYEWYLWGELVLVDWDKKGIVVWQYWYGCLEIIYINSKTTDTVDINRVTSTTKSSELAEEIALYDQANKLLSKADDIVKEAGEIKMRAVKKRTNLIYLPK